MRDRFFHRAGWIICVAMLLATLLPVGCETEGPSEPEPDRGVALRNIALLYSQQITSILNLIRPRLLVASHDLVGIDPASGEALAELERLLESSSDYLLQVSILDTEAVILQSRPDSTLQGDSLGSLPAYDYVQNTLASAVSAVNFCEQGSYFDYIFPIIRTTHFEGMLRGAVSLDTLVRRGFAYSNVNSSEEEDHFLLDSSGIVLYASNSELIRTDLTDSTLYDPEFSELGKEMIEAEAGDDVYQSDDAPGAGETGGRRLVGWVRFYLEENFWVLAVSEPMD